MTYRSRPPQRMPEQWKSMPVALGGGMVEDFDPLSVDPGRLVQAMNWEAIYGVAGYRTIKGYERFNGRGAGALTSQYEFRIRAGTGLLGTDSPSIIVGQTIRNYYNTASGTVISIEVTGGDWSDGTVEGVVVASMTTGVFGDQDPLYTTASAGNQAATCNSVPTPIFDGDGRPSSATYAVLGFDAGTTTISAGETITNVAGTSALVVEVDVTSGSFAGGDAAGNLLITSITGEWVDDDQIRVSGVQRATANGDPFFGTRGDDDLHQERLTAARNALRDLITAPTGSGAILGGCVFNNRVYAVRNASDNASATLWRASTSGWTSVKTGLEPSCDYKFCVATFTGDPADIAAYFVNGVGRLRKMTTAEVVTKADPIYASEATSTTNLAVGTGSKAFTLVETSRDFTVGEDVVIHKTTDAAIRMVGTISAWADPVLTVTVATAVGSGSHNTWEIGLADYSDKPFDLLDHKDHLFLLYPNGQLQTSNLGDPMVYTTTASLFGLGSELTGVASLRGDTLAIFTEEKIQFLSGTSATDWQLSPHARGLGAVLNTIQNLSGNAIFLDDRGLTTLQATQNYGDFEPAIMSRNVKTTLDAYRDRIIGCRMVKGYNQYRLYFSDGTQLRGTIQTGNPVLTDKDMAFTVCRYAHNPTCLFGGKLDGVERNFFGTEDGYLMEEDIGTSFDGETIEYAMRLPFNHAKSPGVTKRWHKLTMQMRGNNAVDINLRSAFSMDDIAYRPDNNEVAYQGAGGYFDLNDFDSFRFDLPAVAMQHVQIRGVGNSLSLLIFFESDFIDPVTLHSLIFNYSILGIER